MTRAVGHGLGWDAAVEGRKADAVVPGEGKKIEVGHARGREERGPGQMGGIEQ
jgi:hypothetical protein